MKIVLTAGALLAATLAFQSPAFAANDTPATANHGPAAVGDTTHVPTPQPPPPAGTGAAAIGDTTAVPPPQPPPPAGTGAALKAATTVGKTADKIKGGCILRPTRPGGSSEPDCPGQY